MPCFPCSRNSAAAQSGPIDELSRPQGRQAIIGPINREVERLNVGGEPALQIGVQRLREAVHRWVEFGPWACGTSCVRQTLDDERALLDAGFRQPAVPSFGVCPCRRGEIDAERLRQRPMRGELLSARQPSTLDVRGQGRHDAQIDRAFAIGERRYPIRTNASRVKILPWYSEGP